MLIGKIKKSQRDLIALETMRIRSRKNAKSRVQAESVDSSGGFDTDISVCASAERVDAERGCDAGICRSLRGNLLDVLG